MRHDESMNHAIRLSSSHTLHSQATRCDQSSNYGGFVRARVVRDLRSSIYKMFREFAFDIDRLDIEFSADFS